MSGRMIFQSKTFWQIHLVAFVACAAPISLWSQVSPFRQTIPATIDQPFSGYNNSLIQVADTLLASAAQATVNNKGSVEASSISRTSHAVERLNLLRPVVEPILRSRGVPVDLTAVILVESGARTNALSPKGARGLWQLMPNTARRYGLRVDYIEDDRLNLSMATDAAAQYLHDLYAQFGDWKLALAAYNTGEANVGTAISKAHTRPQPAYRKRSL